MPHYYIYPEQATKPSPYSGKEDNDVRTMELFFGIFAHEIRSELSGIEQCLRVVQTGTNAVQFLQAANIISRRTLDVLDNMLATVKLHAGSLTVQAEKDTFSFNTWLNTIIQPLKAAVLEQQLYICLSVDPSLDCANITTDKVKLAQILRNLLTNAVKFSYPQGYITLRCLLKQDELILQVINQGDGFPTEKTDYIFEPYTQFSHGHAGTGLGLYITKLYVQALHGKITAESKENSTTVFTIQIPDCIHSKHSLNLPQR